MADDENEVLDAVGTEVEVAPQQSTALFGTSDPGEVVERATTVANRLKDVLTAQGLTSNIQGKQYVRVEGWQTVGIMCGVTAMVTRTTPTDDGFIAHAEALMVSTGQVIGAADAMCDRTESRWAGQPNYAVLSMAETRAVSKVLRSVLGFVVTLAGYEATPFEEMDSLPQSRNPRPTPGASATAGPTSPKPISAKQRRLFFVKAKEAGVTEEGELKGLLHYVGGEIHTDRFPANKFDELLEAVSDLDGVYEAMETKAKDGDVDARKALALAGRA